MPVIDNENMFPVVTAVMEPEARNCPKAVREVYSWIVGLKSEESRAILDTIPQPMRTDC